jgi:hypothetical protein
MGARDQFIERVDDLLAFSGKRLYERPQVVCGNRDRFERMQDHRSFLDNERWVEARKADCIQVRFPYQGYDDAPSVVIEDGRLHDYDVRDGVAVLAAVAMNVELRHLERGMLVCKGAVLLGERVPSRDGPFQRFVLSCAPGALSGYEIDQ